VYRWSYIMIELTQEEVNAINIIAAQAQNLQAQLNQVLAAQKAVVTLLEKKYKAKFNPETGQLEGK
ncbi:MAG: hypothetical protein NWE89_00690, partial [Candidatus Bathyarchaeota archaeon]|nr:hypothetical protein [Candidatus Bathyarchaeota archaeon]